MSPESVTPSLTIVREYRNPPQQIWEAWTSAEALKRWMAPSAEFKTPTAEVDLRTGGRYHIVMIAPDGVEHDVSGVYREILPLRRLVFTWAWRSAPERESLVTIDIEPVGAGTRLTLTHARFADEAARDHHQSGWIGCLGQLERHIGASADPLTRQSA
ncbi:MAG: SRPBCC family protein [Steroidobacterales bacterium]